MSKLAKLCLLLSVMALGTGCQLQPSLTAALPRTELKLKLNLQPNLRPSPRFQILSPSQPEEVHSLRFCLLEHPTGSPPAGGTDLVPHGQVFTVNWDYASQSELNFGNVRGNLADQSYSVAVAAFDLAGNNITNSTG
ncbi:MAG: hypothetical protein CVV27_14345, partial [Candidatus Melainabacteria bacterium HGW-Melainabacteria-1]